MKKQLYILGLLSVSMCFGMDDSKELPTPQILQEETKKFFEKLELELEKDMPTNVEQQREKKLKWYVKGLKKVKGLARKK